MHLAVFSVFAASRTEPLADALTRVREAFIAAGLGEPLVRFSFTDPPQIRNPAILAAMGGVKRVSSTGRVLKRFPAFERFARPGAALSNLSEAGEIEPVEFSSLAEIARGVPRSFPFHNARFHLSAPGFSEGPDAPHLQDPNALGMLMRAGVDIGAGHPTTPGISLQDSWWVNGRQRSMAALRIVEVGETAKKLPPPPAHVAALFASCGKVRKTIQLPVAVGVVATQGPAAADLKSTDVGQSILAILRAHRAGLGDLAETLPHDLPPLVGDAALDAPASGPKKPELERCFGPLGYGCKGESGAFRLRRRTSGNLTVELNVDVGTWSDLLAASFSVSGMTQGRPFKAAMSLPPCRQASRGVVRGVELVGQFPIGGPERWRQLAENLAALVTILDAGFVPEIEAVAGPSPDWYRPDGPGA